MEPERAAVPETDSDSTTVLLPTRRRRVLWSQRWRSMDDREWACSFLCLFVRSFVLRLRLVIVEHNQSFLPSRSSLPTLSLLFVSQPQS